jgi:hypothetical protein
MNRLGGVSADSATDAWAVGEYFTGPTSHTGKTLILHWNGTAWSKVPSPNPRGRFDALGGVTAISPTDAWAVGAMSTSTDGSRTLILHWNGTAWSQVPSPNPSSHNNGLGNVTAVSATDAWAVGSYGNESHGKLRTLILHWNGTAWSKVKSPDPGSANPREMNVLYGISANSSTSAWAVGYVSNEAVSQAPSTLTLRWNGTAWSRVKSPGPTPDGFNGLSGVAAISDTDALAVGANRPSSVSTVASLALNWNGTAWSQAPTPDPGRGGNSLAGVSAVSATDAWAVGSAVGRTKFVPTHTVILHWNGTAWTRVTSPDPGGTIGTSELDAVDARTATDAWAVGDYISQANGAYDTLILHWNGTSWKQT